MLQKQPKRKIKETMKEWLFSAHLQAGKQQNWISHTNGEAKKKKLRANSRSENPPIKIV